MRKLIICLLLFIVIPTSASAAHTVKHGDTLWNISKEYDMSYQKLMSYNPQVTNQNIIRVGDKINVTSEDAIEDLLAYAKSLQTVTTYVYGGQNAPYQTDCSGWTQHIYKRYGVALPRVSKQQANVGTSITFKNMKKGDLMFFSSREDKTINHVGIYLGDGYWISNLNSQYSVKIESVWSNYCQKYFLWAQRVML